MALQEEQGIGERRLQYRGLGVPVRVGPVELHRVVFEQVAEQLPAAALAGRERRPFLRQQQFAVELARQPGSGGVQVEEGQILRVPLLRRAFVLEPVFVFAEHARVDQVGDEALRQVAALRQLERLARGQHSQILAAVAHEGRRLENLLLEVRVQQQRRMLGGEGIDDQRVDLLCGEPFDAEDLRLRLGFPEGVLPPLLRIVKLDLVCGETLRIEGTAHPGLRLLVLLGARVGDYPQELLVPGNAPHVFGRTRPLTRHAAGIAQPRRSRQDVLEHDIVLPAVTEIVLVRRPGVRQGEVIGDPVIPSRKGFVIVATVEQLPRDTQPHRALRRLRIRHLENVQMAVHPTHRILHRHMEIPETVLRGHQNPPPNRRLCLFQSNAELIYVLCSHAVRPVGCWFNVPHITDRRETNVDNFSNGATASATIR